MVSQRRLWLAAPVIAAALTCTLPYPVHALAVLGVPRSIAMVAGLSFNVLLSVAGPAYLGLRSPGTLAGRVFYAIGYGAGGLAVHAAIALGYSAVTLRY